METRKCPQCGGDNINYQREQSSTIGAGVYHATVQKKHGCLWWLCIGWWAIWIIWPINLVKKVINAGGGVNAAKVNNKTVAVCQHCGYSWRIE